MDRRQRKTREAIFKAFISLLSKNNITKITVSDIIEAADVGRATFYAHFETKDFLVKELCEELFCHIFDCVDVEHNNHRHIFECDSTDSGFLHLLVHLQKNDNNILELLSCQNNELFILYFKDGLIKMIESMDNISDYCNNAGLPKDYFTNHVATAFVETVKWWIKNGLKLTPQEVSDIFYKAIGIQIKER